VASRTNACGWLELLPWEGNGQDHGKLRHSRQQRAAACTRSARGQGGCCYWWQGSFRPSCQARACGRRTAVSRRAVLGEATAAYKWWWSAVLPVLATGKDGVARDKEARAVHGEPRRKTRNEGETVKRDGLMEIKILWRREKELPCGDGFCRGCLAVTLRIEKRRKI